MKKKSIKVENGVAPASEVITKTKKVVRSATDSMPAVEPAMEIDTESKVSLKKKIKSEHGVAPASKAIKKSKKMVTTTTDLAPEIDMKSEPVESKPIKNEDDCIDKEEENLDKKGDKVSPRKGVTIFVANLPPTTKKSQLKALFNKYGTIKTIRFRTNDGQTIYYKQELKHVLSLNAYVRFSSKEEMEKACEMNGTMVGENRIRVCPENKKQIGGVSSTVFVGNIKRGTSENDLYDFFSQVGPVEFVRYLSQKNIAYVCFKKGVSMKKVLKLDQEKLNNRPLRVQLVDVQRSNVKVNKKGNTVKRRKFLPKSMKKRGADAKADAKNGGKANDDFHGKVAEAKNKNKTRSHSSGFGSVKHKKMLSKKLQAAMDKE